MSGFEAPKVDPHGKLAAATVGLVSKEEFTRRREELEQAEAAAEQQQQAAASGSGGGEGKKKKKKKALNSTLSFGGDDEEEEGGGAVEDAPKRPKLGKNPSVDTSMLFDAEREAELAQKKERLVREWKEEQERVKSEKLEVTYSYHDPSGRDGLKGHRNSVTLEKGSTIDQFLNRCREQNKDLRGCSSDQLIYVKEDLIMPHSVTFHELIVKKARGKSGPLFNFDVHEDVRVGAFDHRVEKDESHPGKVMLRSVYDRNKDKFPYSRFEVYDPNKKWETYTTHGAETDAATQAATSQAIGAFGVRRVG